MQCLKTYDMDAPKLTFHHDDKNIAEIIKKIIADAGLTVGELFEDDDITEYIHDAGIPVDVVYDEDDILACGCVTDKIEELEHRLGELEDEKDYMERDHRDELKKVTSDTMKMVRDAEHSYTELREAYREGEKTGKEEIASLIRLVAELRAKVAELERKLAVSNEALVCLGYRVDDEPCEVVSEEE